MADQPTFPGSTYAGLAAGKYISAALLSAPTIENGGVTVLENVKGKSVLQTLDTSSIFTDATCDFDDTQTVTMGEQILTVKDMQVNLQLCRSQFHDTFSAIEMGASAFADIPKSFEDYLLGYVASKVAASNETLLWTGALGANAYDGFETLGAAQIPAGQQIAAVAGGIDAANVIDEMGKVVDAIPTTVYGKEDLKIYCASNVARAYVRALGGFAAAGLGANGTDNKGTQWYTNGSLSFDGIQIFVANGMSDDSMMAACVSNLYFGTSLLTDWANAASVIPVHLYDGSDNVRVVMRMTAGAQIGIANDCVLYS